MTPHDLLANFRTLAEAPNGIQRLRELVLELAVRGKLVEQDPGDVPADELLKVIKAEKSRFIANGAIRGGRQLPDVGPEEASFELPATWRWSRLRTISRDLGQKIPDAPFSYIDVGSIDNQRGQITKFPEVLDPAAAPSRARKLVSLGTVIFSTVRPYLMNIAIVEKGYDPAPIVSTAFGVLHPFQGIDSTFLFWMLRSPFFMSWVADRAKGVAYPAISDGDLQMAPVPVPPVAEQGRIVARVDELMALLDRLEAKRQEREAARTAARDSAFAALLDAPTLEDVEVAWLRIHEQFAEFLACPEDVEIIKKMVFQLAITGRLSRQDPSDESVQKLFRRIETERIQYSKSTSFRGTAPLAIDPAKIPFPIPISWRWARLGSIFNAITDGDHLPPPRSEDGIAFLTIGNITSGALDFTDCRQVPESYFQDIAEFRRPSRGDILYTVVGATYGRPALVTSDRPFCVQRHIAILKPPREIEAEFLMVLLRSPLVYDQASSSTTGTAQPTVPLGALRNFLVPIPPIEEQGRILKKVGDLMVNLDQLVACHLKIRTDWEAFASAAVHHLDN